MIVPGFSRCFTVNSDGDEVTSDGKSFYIRASDREGSVALLVARRTNDRKLAGSRPTKVVCITVLTGNRMGVNCPLWPAATPSSEL